jgi:beta-glucosidase
VADPLTFPADFLWGAATAAHQVEGDNRNSDWWEWETDGYSRVPLAEPSGSACDHFHRYRDDIALLAGLGLNAYRFSVEWARVEPRAGEFDEAALAHYSDMVTACVQSGVTPIVTLQHFTLPAWVGHAGSWLNPDMPDYFARYTRKVVERFGDRVRYFCTINEPGNLLTRGYLGTFPTPPFIQDLTAFETAAAAVNAAHRRSREVIKQLFPSARVGMAHALQDWHANAGGAALMAFARELYEDQFFAEAAGDDFIGVQTYTQVEVDAPRVAGPLIAAMLRSRRLTEVGLLPLLRSSARAAEPAEGRRRDDGRRRTQMGWLWAPEAVEATARRVGGLFPGKELLITEHGLATDDDAERIEYIDAGLRSIRRLLGDGLAVSGYFYWSLLDNYEWWHGYRPRFGLIAVDRTTQERTVKASGRWYGGVASNKQLPALSGGLTQRRPNVRPIRFAGPPRLA